MAVSITRLIMPAFLAKAHSWKWRLKTSMYCGNQSPRCVSLYACGDSGHAEDWRRRNRKRFQRSGIDIYHRSSITGRRRCFGALRRCAQGWRAS